MKRVAIIFLAAVLGPSLVLAVLALRAQRDREWIAERQRALLYQGVVDSLALEVNDYIEERQVEFRDLVDAWLAESPPDAVAAEFNESLRGRWELANVGFVSRLDLGCLVTPGQEAAGASPEVAKFIAINRDLLVDNQPVPVFVANFGGTDPTTVASTAPPPEPMPMPMPPDWAETQDGTVVAEIEEAQQLADNKLAFQRFRKGKGPQQIGSPLYKYNDDEATEADADSDLALNQLQALPAAASDEPSPFESRSVGSVDAAMAPDDAVPSEASAVQQDEAAPVTGNAVIPSRDEQDEPTIPSRSANQRSAVAAGVATAIGGGADTESRTTDPGQRAGPVVTTGGTVPSEQLLRQEPSQLAEASGDAAEPESQLDAQRGVADALLRDRAPEPAPTREQEALARGIWLAPEAAAVDAGPAQAPAGSTDGAAAPAAPERSRHVAASRNAAIAVEPPDSRAAAATATNGAYPTPSVEHSTMADPSLDSPPDASLAARQEAHPATPAEGQSRPASAVPDTGGAIDSISGIATPAADSATNFLRNTVPMISDSASSQPAAVFSSIAARRSAFFDLVRESVSGAVSRVVDDRITVLFWYRPPAFRDYVFGVELKAELLKEVLSGVVDVALEVPGEACVALLDESGLPVARSLEGFSTEWSRPFVSREIGQLLPRWEMAAYLADPGQLSAMARSQRLQLWLLVCGVLAAIAAGGILLFVDARRRLVEARQKTDFVSNVSHELRTPLTSIRMFADLLRGDSGTDAARRERYAEVIESEADRLSRLINNVLDFSRLERGDRKFRMEALDLRRLARDTVEQLVPQLAKAGMRVALDEPPTPVNVRGDADAISQILVNLLSNAEKYAAGGGEVTVQVAVNRPAGAGAEPDRALLRVCDRGPGVPRGVEKRIFDRFFRNEDSLTSSIPGTGLGLTLARQMARAHGGDLRFEPNDGGGSCFVVDLPLEIEPRTPGGGASGSEAPTP